MHDQLDDQLATRLRALADPTDDADWLDVRRRVSPAAPLLARPRVVRRRRRLRLLAACMAAVAAISAAIELLPGDDGARGRPGLDAVAAIAVAAPSTVPGAHEYAYTKLQYGAAGDPADCTEEWWIAADGSGRVRQRGAICVPFGGDRRFGPGKAMRAYVGLYGNAFHGDPADLPTDAGQLERVLEDTLRGLSDVTPEVLADPERRSDGMLDVIDQVLANPLAPPEVRAALYRVAGSLQGMHVEQGVIDPAGRSGSAITVEHRLNGERERRELIFDPTTSMSLASRETRMLPDGQARVVFFLAYLDRGTVPSLDARP